MPWPAMPSWPRPSTPCKRWCDMRTCKGCGSATRKLDFPGPRCGQCWRTEKKRRGAAAHEQMVQKEYGLEPGEYEALYALQGGRCAICQHAMGLKVRLAVDHDHATGRVRGLTCKICNRLIGIAGDKPDLFIRGINYLNHPPYDELQRGKNE